MEPPTEYKPPRHQQRAALPYRSLPARLPTRNLTSLLFPQGLQAPLEPGDPNSGSRRCFLPAFPARWPVQGRGRGAKAPLYHQSLLQTAEALPIVRAGHRGPDGVGHRLVTEMGPRLALFPSWPIASPRLLSERPVSHPRLYPPPSLPLRVSLSPGQTPQ